MPSRRTLAAGILPAVAIKADSLGTDNPSQASYSGAIAPWPRINFRVPAGPSKITVPTYLGPVPLMPESVPVPYSS